ALPYLLTNGFGVSGEATLRSPIPPAVKLAFYIGSGVFFASVLYTILTTREYAPEDLQAFQRLKAESAGVGRALREIFGGIASMPRAMRQLAVVQFFTWFALFCMWLYFVPAVATGVFHGQPLGVHEDALKAQLKTEAGQTAVAEAALVASAYQSMKEQMAAPGSKPVQRRSLSDALLHMLGLKPAPPEAGERLPPGILEGLIANHPPARGPVAREEAESPLVQTFAAAFLKHHVSAANPRNAEDAAADIREAISAARNYQEGAAWGGVCFSAYNGTAFVFAFILLALVKVFSARAIHRVCLVWGGLGLLLSVVWRDPHWLIGSMVLVGVAWASILSMPYAMLANAIPAQKMGFYMGVFNFFIVIPQILASLGLGLLMKLVLGDHPMNAVLLGGASMVLAGLCVGLVSRDVDKAGAGTGPHPSPA
ncbi:MAG TPA: hypothetical protein VMU04_12730, partial [Candidatus Acidoferrum sp.]|nr:hypothetical protein [Candidatus Acidoferrum sp.]